MSFDPGELTKSHVRKALMINGLTEDDIAIIHKALIKYMTSELTEDDVVTVRKELIRDIIFDLRKALYPAIVGKNMSSKEDIRSNAAKTIDRLYQIVNEEIS